MRMVTSGGERGKYYGGRCKHAVTQARVELWHDIYYSSVASQVVGKMPKIGIFSGDASQ